MKKFFKKLTFKKQQTIIVFAYARIMQFPDNDFIIPNITTKTFNESVHNIMPVKVHFDHSQEEKIQGNAHQFSNWALGKTAIFLRV